MDLIDGVLHKLKTKALEYAVETHDGVSPHIEVSVLQTVDDRGNKCFKNTSDHDLGYKSQGSPANELIRRNEVLSHCVTC